MKYYFLLLCPLLFVMACTPEEEVQPISENIHEATYDYDFFTVESQIGPVLLDYAKAYAHSMDASAYPYGNTYKLDRFHVAVVVHDENQGNVPAAFVFRPAGSNFAPDAEQTSVIAEALDGGTWVRQTDRQLSQRMMLALQSPRSSFAPFTEDGVDYVVFRLRRDELSNMSFSTRNRFVGFFIHEGFHLYPQREMDRPEFAHSGIRFNLPADYPADATSFSLIGAGVQLNSNLLYGTETVDWNKMLAMQYTLFEQLIAADTSGQDYIEGFYLPYAWLEGGAEFAEEHITIASGVFNLADENIRQQNSYANFIDGVQRVIDSGESTVIVNGVRRENRYHAVVGRTFYPLGAASLRILEGLGEDPLAALTSGRTPHQLLGDYIRANNVEIDETAALADLQSLVDWEGSLALMEAYLEVF